MVGSGSVWEAELNTRGAAFGAAEGKGIGDNFSVRGLSGESHRTAGEQTWGGGQIRVWMRQV